MADKKLSKDLKRILTSVLLGFGTTLVVLFMYLVGILEKYEWNLVDIRFHIREFLKPANKNPNIVIVDIDEESLKTIGQWPFPRGYFARLIRQLKQDGAKVVCFDILFSEPDRHGEDREFGKAEAETKFVIQPLEFYQEKRSPDVFKEQRTVLNIERIYMPVSQIAESAASLGFVNMDPESDGVYRKINLVKNYQGENYFSLSLALASFVLGVSPEAITVKEGDYILLMGNEFTRKIPIDSQNKMFINFQGGFKTFKYIPFDQAYYAEYRKASPDFFKNKIVIIGSSAPGLADLKPTPFSPLLPGVEIQASILNTILQEDYIKESPLLLNFLLIVILGFSLSVSLPKISPFLGAIVTLVIAILYLTISSAIFVINNYLLITLPPLFTVLLAYLAVTSYRLVTEERHKRKIRAIFQRYVTPQVVSLILKDIDSAELSLGGRRKKLTILFTDIRNFTGMSEKMKPEEVVHMLNEYFTTMTDVVFEYDGTVDKFMGDSIMAFWGAPVSHKDDTLRAVKCAWRMQKELEFLKEKWITEGREPMNMGIGVNTGEVVVGNIGSPDRMEYTVIGDDVNLASRLQSIAPGGAIFISETTYEEVKDYVEVIPLPPVKVKGKTEPVKIYQLTGIKEE